jgi:DNA (cytosine-5)-methyltransferase 1
MGAKRKFSSVEFCAGAGGQALGLEQAGFAHRLLVDNDTDCCATLRHNRPDWRVECADMRQFVPLDVGPVDLLSAGLPCPPFSIAGKQLGERDERNLFPAALRLIEHLSPRVVLIENVRGFLSSGFAAYRQQIADRLNGLGYTVDWRLHDAQAFGVPQTRSRVTILAARTEIWSHLQWPDFTNRPTPNVGDVLHDLMAENGWHGVDTWAQTAKGVAPTIVGGSKKHGGPDLGPTRARAKWREMGVNGSSIADAAPEPDFVGLPRLTTRMVARLQGFPDDWHFTGRKTAAYRQIGNAFPPPVAQALGHAIAAALSAHDRDKATDCKVAAE